MDGVVLLAGGSFSAGRVFDTRDHPAFGLPGASRRAGGGRGGSA